VDIGGTKCAVILGSYDENAMNISILDRIAVPTEQGLDNALNNIYKLIDDILSKNNHTINDICSIGISCGGPLNSINGIILSPPNLIGWDNVHIVEILEKKYGVTTKLQNDAKACALAEWKFGAGKGFNNVIFLTFGTGMGAGLILEGKLYNGTNCMAGEVGHIRLADNGPVGFGKAGSFEGFCSGGGIAQLAKTKVLEQLQIGNPVSFCKDVKAMSKLTTKDIAIAAKKGDLLAIEIFKIAGNYLGKGLSLLIDILNPEVIIIGSVFLRTEELLWPQASKVIDKETISHSRKVCKVVPSGLKEQIGDYAALAVALD
jgi:glucokinase